MDELFSRAADLQTYGWDILGRLLHGGGRRRQPRRRRQQRINSHFAISFNPVDKGIFFPTAAQSIN